MARARIRRWWAAPLAVVVIAGGAAAGVVLERAHRRGEPSAPRDVRAVSTRTSTAGAPSVTSTSSPATRASTSTSTGPASSQQGSPTRPLRLVSATPASKATGVGARSPIVLDFSAPLASNAPTPSLSPPTAGTWSTRGATMTFTPSAPFLPLSTVSVTIPKGPNGPQAVDGGELTAATTISFRVEDGSILRLDQLLSLLDYSPLAWSPAGSPVSPADSAAQAAALYVPPAGHFSWRQTTWPSQLRVLWKPGRYNVMTRGLVMEFQADHGMQTNGALGPGLWRNLLSALAGHEVNRGGYNYALADKHLPESLTIWHDGAVVLHVLANTGIASDPTPDGIFPVDTRLRNQIMRGTNPNGSHYADPVQYVAYFHHSDAVHYIYRAAYGFPQSLGCIELSLTDAAKAWPYLAYGTLVEVIG